MFYTHLPKRTQGNLSNLYKSEEEIGREAIEKAEQADIIIKGRKGEPIGTKKTWGGIEYVKTAQGWSTSKKVKAAHEAIHGKPEEKKGDHGVEVGKEYDHHTYGKVKVKSVENNDGDKKDSISHFVTFSHGKNEESSQGINGFKQSLKEHEKEGKTHFQSVLDKEKSEGKKELTPDEHGAEAAKHFDQSQKEYFRGNHDKANEHHEKGHEHLMHALGKQKDKFNAVYNNPEVKHVTVGGEHKPLSSQLQAETGDHYNAQDFDGNANTGSVITHKKTGQKYTVINHKQADLVKHYQDKNKPAEGKEDLHPEAKKHFDKLVDRYGKQDEAGKKVMRDNSKQYVDTAHQFDKDNGTNEVEGNHAVAASKHFLKHTEGKDSSIPEEVTDKFKEVTKNSNFSFLNHKGRIYRRDNSTGEITDHKAAPSVNLPK